MPAAGTMACQTGDSAFALLLSFGTYIEIAVPPGEAAAQLSRRFLDELEEFVRRTGSYRGKVISLDRSDGYSGKHTPVYVHKLHNVQRDEVILQKRLCDFSTGISGTLCVNVRTQEARTAYQEGSPLLWRTRNGKDSHSSLSSWSTPGSHNTLSYCGTSCKSGPLFPARPFPAARDDRDRGCRSDRTRPRKHVRTLRRKSSELFWLSVKWRRSVFR